MELKNMNKRQKINWIKAWLQRFGDRDNETFNIEIMVDNIIWKISLQYNFDFEGEQLEPYDWCRRNFKHVHNNTLYDRTEEELTRIIEQLKMK